MPLQWKVHSDGSFDLLAPGPGLRNCYPALDGAPIHPLGVRIA